MKTPVHIQRHPGKKRWLNSDCSVAAYGFHELGYHVHPFHEKEFHMETFEINALTPVVGDPTLVGYALGRIKRFPPDRLGYPHNLRRLMDQPPATVSLGEVRTQINRGKLLYPIFLKPDRHYKVFSSRVVSDLGDILDIYTLPDDLSVLKIPAFEITASYRFYMLEGECQGSCFLQGNPAVFPAKKAICRMFRMAKDTVQTAYSVDMAVAHFPSRPERIQDPTVLIGAKDVFTMGSRCLPPKTYATMLQKRWAQLQTTSR